MARTSRILIMIGAALFASTSAAPRPASAGPVRYDPTTKSLKFTYTFAAVSPGVLSGTAIGQPQDPTAEQHAIVRGLLKEVSDALSLATRGRASISSLDRVDNVKDADIIISMTGKPASPGWAMPGAIEGKPGQIAMFYQTLADQPAYNRRDAVLTTVHEICHYIFQLTDEYNFSRGCPLANPGGPGCLMDNYLTNGTRHGWYGRLCNDQDHVGDPRQRNSCQALVDQFFAQRGNPTPSTEDQTDQKFENLADAALGKAKEEVQAKIQKSTSTLLSVSSGTLRSAADRFLRDQVKKNGLNVPAEQIRRALERIGKESSSVPFGRTGRFSEDLVSRLRARGRSLAQLFDKGRETSRRPKILRELLQIARTAGEVGGAPLTTDERKFVDQIARDASTLSPDEIRHEKLIAAAKLHIKFDQEIAVTTVEIADELGIPGTPDRLSVLRQLNDELKENALPGRTANRFGRRRTIIIAPDPLNPAFDLVFTQSGIVRYADIRRECLEEFARLIDRTKILPTLIQGDEVATSGLLPNSPQLRADKVQAPDQQARFVNVQRILDLTVDQIRRNRIENIIIMVPPGGLPFDLGRTLESLRGELIGKTDLRMDIVLVGSVSIPDQLRDLAVRSGGSILTATDKDEVGAIAQRLKNDQAAGAWVAIPLQGVLGETAVDLVQDAPKLSPRDLAQARETQIRVKDEEALVRLVEAAKDIKTANTNSQLLHAAVVSVKDSHDRWIKDAGSPRLSFQFIKSVFDVKDALRALRSAPDISQEASKVTTKEFEATGEKTTRALNSLDTDVSALEVTALRAAPYSPLFQRINRAEMKQSVHELEAFFRNDQSNEFRRVRDLLQKDTLGKRSQERLLRFYAEKGAEFELVLGTSRPLLGVTLPLPREDEQLTSAESERLQRMPRLRLVDDANFPVEAPGLQLDRGASTDTILVYRLNFLSRTEGRWYTAVLDLGRDEKNEPVTVDSYKGRPVNYTFSVASLRPNIQLMTALVQKTSGDEIDPPPADLGLIRSTQGQARIEVQVFGGSSVINARMKGFLQKIDEVTNPITGSSIDFSDDGQGSDRIASDGIYTTLIPIDRLARDAEYRVSIQALSTAESRNIEPEDPNKDDEERRKKLREKGNKEIAMRASGEKPEDVKKEEQVLKKALEFQRATSFHFRVRP